MQRVRIGLTGLAFIFVLVLLAAVFSKPSDEEPITANVIEQQRVNADTGAAPVTPPPPAEVAPQEPLAELGVAPGAAEGNIATTTPVAPIPQP